MVRRKIKENLLGRHTRQSSQEQSFHRQHSRDDKCCRRGVQSRFLVLVFVKVCFFGCAAPDLNQNNGENHPAYMFHLEITHQGVAHVHISGGIGAGEKILDKTQKQLQMGEYQQNKGREVIGFFIRLFTHPA